MIVCVLKSILQFRMYMMYRKTESKDYSDSGRPDVSFLCEMYNTYTTIRNSKYMRFTSLLPKKVYERTVDEYYGDIRLDLERDFYDYTVA
jgi:hypothetical protein